MEEKWKIKSLVKAMDVLETFTANAPELGISEISRKTGYPKSVVFNIVSTFRSLGYLNYNESTSKYYLGLKLLHYSYIINSNLGLRDIFIPYLEKIASLIPEINYLGIPVGKEVVYIESVAPFGVNSRSILGERAPQYCTGLGKALLAFAREPNYPTEFKRYTKNTIVTMDDLLEDLDYTRQRGYAIDNMEHEFGVKCIALPVFNHDGEVIAAVSISAPSLRMTDENIEKYVNIMEEVLNPIQYNL